MNFITKLKLLFKPLYYLQNDVDYKNKNLIIHFASDKEVLFVKYRDIVAAIPLAQLIADLDPFSKEVLSTKTKLELEQALLYCEANEMYEQCSLIREIINEGKSTNL